MSRGLSKDIDAEELINAAFKFTVKRKQLQKIEDYYVKNKDQLPKFEEDLMNEIPNLKF